MTKELITIPEFTAKFSMSRSSFYRFVSQGVIKIIKQGRRTLVSNQETERYRDLLLASAGQTTPNAK